PAGDAELTCFGLQTITQSRWIVRARRLLGITSKPGASPIYREPHFHFDPCVAELRPPVYLDGYWQTPKYFSDFSELLRREFLPTAPLEPENAAVAAQIDAVNAVSLHVRRGDY